MIRRRFCSRRVSYNAARCERIVGSDESSEMKCEIRIKQTKKKKATNRVCNRIRLFQSWRGYALGVLER